MVFSKAMEANLMRKKLIFFLNKDGIMCYG